MEAAHLEGRLVPRQRSRALRLLAALSGLLLARSLARFVGSYLLGFRRPCSARLDESGIEIGWTTQLMGRQVRRTTRRIPPWKVESVEREERFRFAPVLVGALFFLAGLTAGFGLVVEWAFTRFGIYLLMGLGLVMLGIAVDAAVVFLVPAARGQSAIVITAGRERLRIEGLDDGSAERFMERAGELFGRRSGHGGGETPRAG
jgi:hypothetical protein